jgi:iron(III) transport system permease protein
MSVVQYASRNKRITGLGISVLGLTFLLALPILVIVGYVFSGSTEVFVHLYQTVLADYLSNSLLLMFGVGVGFLVMGIPTAWLTSVCDFPGRKIFSWALLLPLAVPAYIIAYTYTGLLDFAGPVQTAIRNVTGLGYGEYWFFEIRSLTGAMLMLALVLYPYVYLLSRAAFLEQSASTLEVSRTLGYNQWQGLFRLALPLARPAIIAGLTLALMETLADYGTVQYFGVSTFTTGIFRTFYGFGDSAAAAQLAAFLLGFVALLVLVEKYSRRQARYHSSAEFKAKAKLIELRGWKALMAFLICLGPVTFGFLVPALQLAYWSFTEANLLDGSFTELAWNSFYLAFLAALIAVGMALLLAYAGRLSPQRSVRFSITAAGMGYALPGTIIAIGVIIPFAWFDKQLIALFQHWFDVDLGLILSGTLVGLLFDYTVRFLAVSLGAVQSGWVK